MTNRHSRRTPRQVRIAAAARRDFIGGVSLIILSVVVLVGFVIVAGMVG